MSDRSRDDDAGERGGGRIRRLLREPLSHFVLLGALLFVVEAIVSGPGAAMETERAPIVVSPERVEGLAARYERQTGRRPSPTELRAAVDRFLRSEVLRRRALELGLGEGDDVISQRLIQKMEFILDNRVEVAAPTDESLLAFMEANAERYRSPPRTSFTHIFFAPDRRQGGAEADAEATLAALLSSSPVPERAPERGDPFMLQYDFVRRSADDVRRSFGSAFADALEASRLGEWSGPMISSYGVHLVRVGERTDGGMPSVESVRRRVEAEWSDAAREDAVESAARELIESYPVIIEEGALP